MGQQHNRDAVETNWKIQKHLITNKFKIKSAIPYAILLSETWVSPIEAIVMMRVITYLKKIEQIEEGRWPNVVFNDKLCKRKKASMRKITNSLANAVLS